MFDESLSPIARVPELRWLKNMIVERALTRGDYLLAGGARSDYYIDKFRLFSDPQVLRRIARLFAPIVSELSPQVIGGTELGGVIIAIQTWQPTLAARVYHVPVGTASAILGTLIAVTLSVGRVAGLS